MLDAFKIIGKNYTYSDKNRTLTIELDTSKWNFRLKKTTLFSYQLNINDCSAPCESSTPTPTNVQFTGLGGSVSCYNPYTLANGDTVTLAYTSNDQPALQVKNVNGYLELTSSYYWLYCNKWYKIDNPTNSGFGGTPGTYTVHLGNISGWCLGFTSTYPLTYNVEAYGSDNSLSLYLA